MFLIKGAILPAVGANEDIYEFCSKYIFRAITLGAAPMADFTAMLTAICVFIPFWRELKNLFHFRDIHSVRRLDRIRTRDNLRRHICGVEVLVIYLF